jgi:hypothetical protein
MIRIPPLGLIVIGFFMVLGGVVLPFLMVMGILPSSFFLNFFAYGISVTGLFLGVIGASLYVRGSRK